MHTTHKQEAETHPGTTPASAGLTFATGSMAEAHASIAAIWQHEADRLLRQAYRLLHKTDGADVEGIVSDALIKVLEAWETIKDSTHCRKLLATAVRNVALDAIRAAHETCPANDKLTDPASHPSNTRSTDATVAWLMGLCADDTERLILSLWMAEGNQTAGSTSEASHAGLYVMVDGKRRWFKPAWSTLEVNQLMRRLRVRMGVQLAPRRELWFRTTGTLPGLHFERFNTLHSVSLLLLGPRKLAADEAAAAWHPIPAWSMDRHNNLIPSSPERVPSIPV